MNLPAADCVYALKRCVGIASKENMQNPSELVDRIECLANHVRKEGSLTLGDEPVSNEFSISVASIG